MYPGNAEDSAKATEKEKKNTEHYQNNPQVNIIWKFIMKSANEGILIFDEKKQRNRRSWDWNRNTISLTLFKGLLI